MACAILGAFVLPDFPANSKRFTPRERELATRRLKEDNVITVTEDNPPLSAWTAIRQSLGDWRTWLLTFGYMVGTVVLQ